MKYDVYKIVKTHLRKVAEGVPAQDITIIADGLTRTEADKRILALWRECFSDLNIGIAINEMDWGKIKKATENSMDYAFTHGGLRGFYCGADRYEVVADWGKLENIGNMANSENTDNNVNNVNNG